MSVDRAAANLAHALHPPAPVPTVQAALERWDAAELAVRALADRLAAGQGDALDAATLRAPLPARGNGSTDMPLPATAS